MIQIINLFFPNFFSTRTRIYTKFQHPQKMFIKQEVAGPNNSSSNESSSFIGTSTATADAIQSELERMLAQFNREAVKKEEGIDEDEIGEPGIGIGESGGEDGDGDEEEEEEEEEDEEDEEVAEDGNNEKNGGSKTMSTMLENGTSPIKNNVLLGSGKAVPHKKGNGGGGSLLPNGKKTKGRVKIKMEYIHNKLRRYTTFSKRKTGIMKKANELSTLTGTQVMLLVASETGHVYAYATSKLQPVILSEPGKQLIQRCLSAPDDQAQDLAPSRTEFTFEPPAMGLIGGGGQAVNNSNITNGPINGGSTTGQRKRKATAAVTMIGTGTGNTFNSAAISSSTNSLANNNLLGGQIDSTSPASFSAAGMTKSTRIGQLLNGTTSMESSATIQNGNEEGECTTTTAQQSNFMVNFEDLFGNGGSSDQRKKARMEEGSASFSTANSPQNAASAAATIMDSQQQMKTLREVLKAATANRLQIQKQQNGSGKKASGQMKGTKGTSMAQQKGPYIGMSSGNQQQSTNSQLLGAALLPFLLQGFISSSNSSLANSTSSSINGSGTFSTTNNLLNNVHSQSTATKQSNKASSNSMGNQQNANSATSNQLPPILYQMPQGVVYATSMDDGDDAGGDEEEDDEEEERHQIGNNSNAQSTAASCMAAVCSSAAAGSAPTISGAAGNSGSGCQNGGGISSSTEGGGNDGGFALQQFLSTSILPTLTAATMTQQILTAMKGGTENSASPMEEDC